MTFCTNISIDITEKEFVLTFSNGEELRRPAKIIAMSAFGLVGETMLLLKRDQELCFTKNDKLEMAIDHIEDLHHDDTVIKMKRPKRTLNYHKTKH